MLDPHTAETMDLFYFGGMTYEKIAEAMDTSRGTVTRKLRIARAFTTARLSPGEAEVMDPQRFTRLHSLFERGADLDPTARQQWFAELAVRDLAG